MKAAAHLDPLGLQAQLDIAVSTVGLVRCVDDVVMPATRQLRRLLETGHRDATQDLMATEAIRTWLSIRGMFAPTPRDIGPILLACGSREAHLVGLESLALLLRYQCLPCQVLGTRVSTFTLTIAAQASDAVAVVVVATESRGLARAMVLLRAVDALGVPVFFAGDAFDAEASRQSAPGRYLGSGIDSACTLLRDSLTPAVQR